jgi:hypothetical protein
MQDIELPSSGSGRAVVGHDDRTAIGVPARPLPDLAEQGSRSRRHGSAALPLRTQGVGPVRDPSLGGWRGWPGRAGAGGTNRVVDRADRGQAEQLRPRSDALSGWHAICFGEPAQCSFR